MNREETLDKVKRALARASALSMRDLATIIYATATANGFWEDKTNTPEKLCLIHSEISEALEAYRKGDDKGFAEEMADATIRIFDLCKHLKIDLREIMIKKMKKNADRPLKHGNKRC